MIARQTKNGYYLLGEEEAAAVRAHLIIPTSFRRIYTRVLAADAATNAVERVPSLGRDGVMRCAQISKHEEHGRGKTFCVGGGVGEKKNCP